MLSAAGALRWARQVLAPGMAYGNLIAEAEAVTPGCEGLVFLPYLTGERCPYPDPSARGGWIGLTSRHTRGHLVRAVLEGVTFGMGQIVGLARSLGAPVTSVRVTGGGNRSALWRQLQADVYGVTVESAGDEGAGSAAGAAILAGVGAGVWASVEAGCGASIALRERHEPGADAKRYEPARSVYERLYADLKPAMAGLGSSEQAG
jgi:xylulokinase